jgi:glycyl-tRNA synthetase beta chain
MARHVHLPLELLVGHALSGVAEFMKRDRDEIRDQLMDFLRTRLKGLWTAAGHPTDVAEAVLCAGFDDVADGFSRLEALSELRGSDDFADLMVAFKRMGNIVRKAGDVDADAQVDERLLEPGPEFDLYAAFVELRGAVAEAIEREDHPAALARMASLRPALASFFDDVLVMADDPAVRRNRIALLSNISDAFGRIADFGVISTE